MSTGSEKSPDEQLLAACASGDLSVVERILRDGNVIERINVITDHGWQYPGWTPLHHACAGGHLDIVTLLVTTGRVDINSKNKEGETPLHKACAKNHLEVVQWLIKNAKLNDDTADYVLRWACGKNHLEVVQWLIKNAKLNDDTAGYVLRWACGGGHLDIVTFLVTTGGANVNYKDNSGYTPLHRACIGGHLDVVTFLVTTGHADVNCKNNEGETPLHKACDKGHIDISRFLIEECHASVNATDNNGFTPLHNACWSGNVDLVSYLIDMHKYSIQATTNDGSTPLHIACWGGHLNVTCYLIEKHQASTSATNEDGQTPLHDACSWGKLDVVKYLVTKTNSDVNLKTKNGKTPLDLARGKSHREEYRKIVSFLEEHLDIKSDSSEPQSETNVHPPLTDNEMRILKILLAEHLDQLNENGISLNVALSGALVLSKQSVVEGLHHIGQVSMAKILGNKQVLYHCPPPTGLNVTHELPTSAEISWKTLPEGEQSTVITGYSVQVVGAGSTREISVSDARTTSAAVSKLRPSTSYTFNISAVTHTGNGPIATITSTTPEEESIKSSLSSIPSVQCPVCRNVLIDPCTLQCGHTTCQLCLAKMWEHNDTMCPLCKEPWQVLPSITIDLRDNIASAHSDEVALLKSQYSDEEKKAIEKFLQAKRTLRQENIQNGQHKGTELLITEQPQSNTSIKYGEHISLSVSATGAESLVYVWKKNREDLTGHGNHYIGTNTPTLIISEFFPDDQGKYVCIVKNCNSSIESEPADLKLDFQVFEHPKSTGCDYHAPVSLTVSAVGPGPLTYRWRRGRAVIDDEDCTGVDEATLTIRSFSQRHEGDYSCQVKCNKNSVESHPAKLELNFQIIEQPEEELFASCGESVIIHVSAVGSGQLLYEWKKNQKEIIDRDHYDGIETAALTITSFSDIICQGEYSCIVKNNHDVTIESKHAKVELKLQMIDHPKGNTSIQNGEDVTQTVSAVGPQHLTYRWMKDGQELHSAEDAGKLTIPSFSSEKEGYYSCIISSSLQSVKSKPVLLGLVWKLPGVEECGETDVVVHSFQGQLVEWNGLKLQIHAGSLPEDVQQCTVFIKASLAGEYEFPENTSLVSAIYWLRCVPQRTFIKPITVEIQHCSTKRDPSKLKIVRAFCSQKSLPYKFKSLGGSFNADTFYGVIDMKGFSGVGAIEEDPDSERMYYNQLFYRSLSHQQRHEIHIIFTWNTELHLNHVSQKYPEDSFLAGCHRVIEIEGKEIEVALDIANWTTVMNGQWEIHPAQPMVTKAELDDFKPGRGLPGCVLEARPLCEDFPQLLHQVILNGIRSPHHKVVLSYNVMPSRDYSSGAATPRTTQHQLSSSTIGQKAKIDQHSDPSDVPSATHNLTFSSSMPDEDFFKWLRSKGISDKDCKTLSDSGISSSGFLLCDVEDFDGLTKFGKKQILKISMEVKGEHSDQQPSERDCSYVGSRCHAPQHSSQAEGRDQHTVTDIGDILHCRPQEHQLDLVEENGKEVRVIKAIASRWQDVATRLHFDLNDIKCIKRDNHHESKPSCHEMLSLWLNGKGRQPADWETLIKALKEAEFSELAKELQTSYTFI